MPIATRSNIVAAKKIVKWWKFRNGLSLLRERSIAFFNRDICHNDTEVASLEPLQDIPRDYFFAIKENGRFWGFDIRTLVSQYENEGQLVNPYTKGICNQYILEKFRKRIDKLKANKKPVHFEQATGLTGVQSWNLRVLDLCLSLDILGYRVATQWFSELSITSQRNLYTILFRLWTEHLNLTDEQKELIVPNHSKMDSRLFKWSANTVVMKSDIDSIRRTNLNVMERLISSATRQSDRTLGAMYTVMALGFVSFECKNAYPWMVI